MKKRLWSMTAAGLLALALLSSCAPAAPSPSGTASPVPSAVEATTTPALTPTPSMADATPTPAEPTATPAPTAVNLDFSQEPPLDEYSASIAVPDFLTEEQQDLYRRARFLYNHMFGGETTALDEIRADVETGRDGPEMIEQDGLRYYPATGRYQNWADFDTVIHGLFTDDFWQARNTLEGPPQRSIYKEIDGRLWMAELSRGSGYYYNRNFPDEFHLDAKVGGKICFTVIGHYSPVWPREGETSEERTARREREYEYTLEFPITMVLTANGWRFDEFYSTSADEREDFDPNREPQLDRFTASIAVPDFLTEEQQYLYQRAHCLYLNLFGVTSANVDRLGRLGVAPRQSEYDTVVIDDMPYTVSHGRYRKWEEFDALVHAAFTEKFWDEHNNGVSAVGEPWILFREHNGMLCYLETEKGQGNFYNENFPDEFRLEKQTEDEILFTLIGHYSWVYPKEGETGEERTARRKREYECTQEFPIRMVLTENGWRFDEFHSALADE